MFLLSLPMRGRGLKYWPVLAHLGEQAVAPHAGAWIEINSSKRSETLQTVAPHAGAWIEIA